MSLTACGRRGPVRPPELVVPAPIQELAVANETDGIGLTWERPARYVNGSRLVDLGQFVVQRARGQGAAFAPLATLDIADRDRFRQIKRFRFLDRDVELGILYRYQVVSLTVDRYASAPSEVAEIVRGTPVAMATPAPTSSPSGSEAPMRP